MCTKSKTKILAATGLLLAGVAAAESGSDDGVRIGGAAYLGDLPTHVADARNLFAEHGLRAVVEYSESGKRNLARLRAGETDFALMALTPLVLDRVADSDPGEPDDPVILASLLQSYELTAVLAAPDAGIEQPPDLRGHRVAFEQGTNTEFVWWLFAQFHEIDPSSVETVSMPFSETPEAIASGRVVAAVLPEPWASQVEARLRRLGRGPPRRFDTRSVYAGRWVLVTTRARANREPESCRSVLAAYDAAIEFIENRPAEAISIHASRLEGNPGVVAERWESLDFDINLDWALISSLQEQFLWTRSVGIDNSTAPVSVLELVEPGPLYDEWPDGVQIPGTLARGREH